MKGISVEHYSLRTNAMLNIIRQICSILIPLVTFPYISRILGSECFGKINFTKSIVNYFSLLATLGINAYAIREGARLRSDKEKLSKFISEIYSINVITSILSLVALFTTIFTWSEMHKYISLLAIQSFTIIFSMLGSDWINNIFEDFKYLAIRYIVIQLICLVPIFTIVKTPNDYLIYVGIMVASGHGGNLLNIRHIRKYVDRKFTLHMNFRKHIIPILFLFTGAMAVQIYLNSDITMIGLIRNDVETGVYSSVTKMYTIIKEVVNAITIVVIPRVAEMIKNNQKNEINQMSNNILNILLSLIIPISVGIFFLSREIILLICGWEYISGNYALEILGLALPFSVFSCYLWNAILVPFRKEKWYLLTTILAAAVNIFGNLLTIPKWGMNGAAATTVISEMIVLLLALHFSGEFIKIKICKKNLVSIFLGVIGEILVCCLGKIILNYTFRLFACMLGSIAIYILVNITMKNRSLLFLNSKSHIWEEK